MTSKSKIKPVLNYDKPHLTHDNIEEFILVFDHNPSALVKEICEMIEVQGYEVTRDVAEFSTLGENSDLSPLLKGALINRKNKTAVYFDHSSSLHTPVKGQTYIDVTSWIDSVIQLIL